MIAGVIIYIYRSPRMGSHQAAIMAMATSLKIPGKEASLEWPLALQQGAGYKKQILERSSANKQHCIVGSLASLRSIFIAHHLLASAW